MKKEQRLLRLFGDIDDDLVADAAARPVLRVWLPRITAIAAAIALTVGVVLTQPWAGEKPPVSDGSDSGTNAPKSDSTTTTTSQTVTAPGTTKQPTSGTTTTTATKGTVTTTTTTTSKTTADTTTEKSTTVTTTKTTTTRSEQTTTTRPSTNKTQKNTTTVNFTTTFKPTSKTLVGGTPTTTVGESTPDIWYEPTWEEKPLWRKFPEFERKTSENDDHKMRYILCEIAIDPTMVGEYLEDVNLHGYDTYAEIGYDIVGKIYRINGINPLCAVVLQYPDDHHYYPAVNTGYTPETLGQFLTDLNLREHIRIGTVYHSYRDENSTIHDKQYAGLTVEKVWELLMSDTTLPNVADQPIDWTHKVSFRIDMPLLGITNIGIPLSEDGYMRIYLLGAEKIFYIGEDTVNAFMEYVEQNCRLQKDYELIALPEDTTDPNATTASHAQPPLVTGTTVKPH